MNSLSLHCDCTHTTCTTVLEVKEDSEKKGNYALYIADKKHDFPAWISLTKDQMKQLRDFLDLKVRK